MDMHLKEWSPDYVNDIAKHASNPKIAANMRDAFPSPYTKVDAEQYINMCIMHGDQDRLCRAILVDGIAVGSIGIFPGSDVYCKSAEMGYWLSEDYWGKGIMTRAITEACKMAFEILPVIRIFAEPYASNAGSRKALEKAGFVLEGVMRNGVYKNGQVLDYCMYAILKQQTDRALHL